MKRLVETLATELKDCERILDFGVGTGRFSEPLQRLGFEVAGIDISKKMTSKAKEKGVKNLFLADARSLPFKNKTFEATLSVHLLHLIKEWQKALAEVCRVTRHTMLSLCYSSEDPVREKYDLLLKPYGFERHRPGKSEQKLRDVVVPSKTVFVCSYSVSADDRIANLQQGTSSSQWEIPERVNLEIVQKLKMEFAEKTFRQDLYLSVWEIESLMVCV
jgi:ubiquinone/menaquinone biosynthesis C-methylase UbiE